MIFCFCISMVSNAQQGINYKAVIKDNLGNVVADQNIGLQFNIIQGSGTGGTTVYSENHNILTNTDGIAIAVIGNGSPLLGVFEDINWGFDDHFLNVFYDDLSGANPVDLGTVQFNTVPYALEADNVSGLEAIDEGNGTGWRLTGRNPERYGVIGQESVDLSWSTSLSTSNGATGAASVAMGSVTIASGLYSTAFGFGSESSGEASTSFGFLNNASGFRSTAFGSNTEASAQYSTSIGFDTMASGPTALATGVSTMASASASASFGFSTNAEAYFSLAAGRFNVGGGDPSNWIETDPLFEIGNGTDDLNRTNALTVLKNGIVKAPTMDLAEIVDNKALVTKEYVTDYVSTNVAPHDHLGENWTGGNESLNINTARESNGSVIINNSASTGYGGSFTGHAGILVGASNDDNPDILLKGNISGISSQGIIASETRSSSSLHLRSNDNLTISLDNDYDGSSSASGAFSINSGSLGNVFRITDSGDVGIGDSQPNVLLQVNGSTDASLSYGSGVFMIGDQFDANIVMDRNEIMARDNAAASPLYLQRDGGNVSIGNVGTPNVKLDVGGSIEYTGTITDVSDKRLKENLVPIEEAILSLRQIAGYSYNMKNDINKKREFGIMAQDVQKVFPEMVSVIDEEGHLGVSYIQLVPVLLEAIKEQQKTIEQLTSRIETLEAKNE